MRLYISVIDAVSVSAAQDLFNFTATANMAFKVHAIELGQKSLTTAEMKQIRCRRMPATVTTGSGGSSVTLRKVNGGDAAPTVTARINDTTGQTTSGTAEILYCDVWHFLNGLFWMPAPEQRPVIAPSQGFTVELGTAPSGAMTVSGTVLIEELF